MDILFVCTGNTCRSPMARAIAQKIFSDREINTSVSSAGIYAFQGSRASENSIMALEEIGIDLYKHIVVQLDEDLINKNDIVLTMTSEQRDSIISDYPKCKEKIFTLGEYTKTNEEILDPFGESTDVYRECREQLIRHINELSKIILNK